MNKANDQCIDIIKSESSLTFLDYYFDLKYKRWQDSLKIVALPFAIHEKLKEELYTEHPNLVLDLKLRKEANLKLSNVLYAAVLFFNNSDFISAVETHHRLNGTASRREMYEKYRDYYLKKHNVDLSRLNPYIVSDSMTQFYSKACGDVINIMAKELADE
ncbi:MAG: hypothetical protein WBP45_02960 [Daejeonella sp.]